MNSHERLEVADSNLQIMDPGMNPSVAIRVVVLRTPCINEVRALGTRWTHSPKIKRFCREFGSDERSEVGDSSLKIMGAGMNPGVAIRVVVLRRP